MPVVTVQKGTAAVQARVHAQATQCWSQAKAFAAVMRYYPPEPYRTGGAKVPVLASSSSFIKD